MNITLIRSEGPDYLCSKPVQCHSFYDATSALRNWSWTAPKSGYDKCSFTILDGATGVHYEGRYDLKHWSVESPCLQKHVVRHLEYAATPYGQTEPRVDSAEYQLAQFFKGQQ
ncbi:MAG: hypothetical protein WKG03_03670 [Telluria sp.]